MAKDGAQARWGCKLTSSQLKNQKPGSGQTGLGSNRKEASV